MVRGRGLDHRGRSAVHDDDGQRRVHSDPARTVPVPRPRILLRRRAHRGSQTPSGRLDGRAVPRCGRRGACRSRRCRCPRNALSAAAARHPRVIDRERVSESSPGKGERRMRRLVMIVVAGVLGWASIAVAQDRPKVGVLKLTSSAPIFIGVEKGFFKEFGVEPELVFFQAAAPIATALAAGQLDLGATGLTAALYNIVLGGEKLWIVADKGREWPGYPLTAVVVQKELWEAGLRTVRDLKGKRIGVTQLGSTFHYHIGNILEKEGLTLEDVKIVPLQALPSVLEALKGKQVEAI